MAPFRDLQSDHPSWEQVLADYANALEHNQDARHEDWLQRYPQYAHHLREYIINQNIFEQRFQPLRVAVYTPTPSGVLTSPPQPDGESSLPEVGQMLGGLLIEKKLAHGGMGVVYQAQQSLGDRVRTVALKVLLQGTGARRFREEAATTGRFDHPHIVPVYEQGEDRGRPFFTMKFYPGGSLERAVADGKWPVHEKEGQRRTARMMVDVARAVHHAHQRRVLHRDLKPGNILLDEDGRPSVSDFGIARRLDANGTLTVDGAIVGTPPYMSPEQAASEANLTTAADVYGLGAILYFVLTGRPPHPGKDLLDVLRRVREVEPPPPRSFCRTLDRDLEAICLKCLDKDSRRRYASAEALAEDLERWLAHEPIRARRVGVLGRLGRWCRRNPVVASLCCAVLFLVLAGVVGAAVAVSNLQDKQEHLIAQQEKTTKAYLLARRNLYTAHMKVAERALQENHLARVLKLLEQHIPEPGEEDLRGFEWSYMRRECHKDSATLKGHLRAVRTVRFAAEGRQLISVGAERNLIRWDVKSQEQLLLQPLAVPNLIAKVALSPDERFLALTGDGNDVSLWDVAGRKPLGTLSGHKQPVNAVDFSADGTQLATASEDGTIGVWEVATLKRLLTLSDHKERVMSVAFSPDGKRLASGSVNGVLAVWDLTEKKVALSRLWHHGPMWALAFSPDGAYLATGGFDGFVKVRKLDSGKKVAELRGHTRSVLSLSYSPSGMLLVSGSADQSVKVWRPLDEQLVRTFRGHLAGVGSLAWSKDESVLASGCHSGVVKVWDLDLHRQNLAQPGFINAIVFSQDSQRIVTAGSDKCVHLWDIVACRELNVLEGHSTAVQSVALTPGGHTIISAGYQQGTPRSTRGEVRLWDAHTGKQRRAFTDLPSPALTVVLAPDGVTAAVGHLDGTIRLLDVNADTERGTLKCKGEARSLAFSPDGRWLASGSKLPDTESDQLGEVVLWDAKARTRKASLTVRRAPVWALAFSPDSKSLAWGEFDGRVRLADVERAEVIVEMDGHQGPVRALAFSPDGRRLATGGEDKMVRLWLPTSGEELVNFSDHSTAIWSMAFSPDGKTLATGDQSNRIRLWRTHSPR